MSPQELAVGLMPRGCVRGVVIKSVVTVSGVFIHLGVDVLSYGADSGEREVWVVCMAGSKGLPGGFACVVFRVDEEQLACGDAGSLTPGARAALKVAPMATCSVAAMGSIWLRVSASSMF